MGKLGSPRRKNKAHRSVAEIINYSYNKLVLFYKSL